MKINYSLLLALFVISASAFTYKTMVNDTSETKIEASSKEWTSVEKAVQLAKIDQKKILIDVYTDWCKWCKVMDQKTFADPEMSTFLASNFHLAKFNAEQKETLKFNGKEFAFKQGDRRGYHEFAVDALNGQLAYPSLVVYDSELNKLEVIRGFKSAEDLMKILAPSES